MHKLCLLLIFIVNYSIVTSLLFKTSLVKNEKCYQKQLFETDILKFSYTTSGENAETVEVTIKNQEGVEIYRDESEAGQFKAPIEKSSIYILCFTSKSSSEFYITFDYFSVRERGAIGEIAADKSVKEMGTRLEEIRNFFEDFEKNIKVLTDRRNKHSDILNDVTYSIKMISAIKIATVVLLSALQVIIIQKMFGSEKKIASGGVDLIGGL